MQEVGRHGKVDRAEWFQQITQAFQEIRGRGAKQHLKSQLSSAADHDAAVELLRRLQNQSDGSDLKRPNPSGDGPAGDSSLPTDE
jgi:hypothetical protein